MLKSYKNFIKIAFYDIEKVLLNKTIRLTIPKTKKNNWRSFLKEGMYIDSLQKLSLDKLIKNLFITSAQFFNNNFITILIIKFIINNIYKTFNTIANNGDELNFTNAITTVLSFFIWLIQLVVLLLFMFTF